MKKYLYHCMMAALTLMGLALPATLANAQDFRTLGLPIGKPSSYSPQVSELMRYDDHAAINYNTGCLTPTIPLVHFQDQDFDLPISISYNASGFRPRSADNFVGRDWMLNAGGVVYRQVNGIPDDFKKYKEDGGQEAYTGFLRVLGRKVYDVALMKQNVTQNPYSYAHM